MNMLDIRRHLPQLFCAHCTVHLVAVNHRRAHHRLFVLLDSSPGIVVPPPSSHIERILLEENANQQRRQQPTLHGRSHLSAIDERPQALRPQVRPSSVRFQIAWIDLGSKSNLIKCALATLKAPRKRFSKAHLKKRKKKRKKELKFKSFEPKMRIKSNQIFTDGSTLTKRVIS